MRLEIGDWRGLRFGAVLLCAAMLVASTAAAAQGLSLAAGYTGMSGRIGNAESDHGPIARLGISLVSGSRVSLTVEGAAARLNEVRRQFTSSCIISGDVTGTCHFDSSWQDTDWSLGTIVRYSPGGQASGPYGVAGIEFHTIRAGSITRATDDDGNILTNFSGDYSSNDHALGAVLGVGIAGRPVALPFTVFVEGRLARLIHNYSGGLQADWNPSIVLGGRSGR